MDPLFKLLNNYPYEMKKTSRTRDVLVIKSTNRSATQNEIETLLKKQKFTFFRKKDSALSGSTEVTEIAYGNGSVVLVFKPLSGGMNETTLNSTITELSPALAFTEGYKPKTVDDFYDFLKNVNHDKATVYVVDRDRAAGKKFIDDYPISSKFKEKMTNAMGVLKYLNEEHKKNPIKNIYWGYRAKPEGVSDKHKGDLFLEYKTGKLIGVSLKAGEEKSKEPKLNTYVKPVLESLNEKDINKLRFDLYKNIYHLFSNDKDNYDSKNEKKEVIKKLAALEKLDVVEYDRLYDVGLDIIRKYITKNFEANVETTVAYLNKAIVGKETVPLVVLKAFRDEYAILTDEDEVGAFLSKTKSIKSYPSTTSKQDFYIELISSPTSKLKMKFAVRTNKVGDEHKLGQFFNLAVKFNGII